MTRQTWFRIQGRGKKCKRRKHQIQDGMYMYIKGDVKPDVSKQIKNSSVSWGAVLALFLASQNYHIVYTVSLVIPRD